MITMQEWKAMSCNDKTTWLEDNCLASNMSLAKRGLVFGVGVNDAHYCTNLKIDGRNIRCPSYMAWAGMLGRAYSQNEHKRHPAYIGVTVCKDWHFFMSFRKWWIENQVDGWDLDKDILSDAREYSNHTCLFVPQWLNKFTADRGASRGEWPIGVDFQKCSGRFLARCCNPITKKQENLGRFNSPEEAHLAWRTRKLDLALELKPKMDEIDLRIYPRVVEIINNAK